MPTRRKSARERELEAEIKAMEALAVKAEAGSSFSSAVQARAKVSSLRGELARLRSEAEGESETDPLRRLQRLQRAAAEDGSWVAAANLYAQEQSLLAARDAERRAAEDAARVAASEAEHLAEIEAALRLLDPTELEELVRRVKEPIQ